MYYSDKFKKDVVNRYLNGESVPKIHKDTGVSKSTTKYFHFVLLNLVLLNDIIFL